MAEIDTQRLDGSEVPQESGSIVNDIILHGTAAPEESAAFGSTEVAANEEEVRAPVEETTSQEVVDNDQTRYQYQQSRADKMLNENNQLKEQNNVLQQQMTTLFEKVQPQAAPSEEPVEEVKEEFPPPPERPQRPSGFNREEAYTDPSSASARHLEDTERWRDNMDEYNGLRTEYLQASIESERDEFRQERQNEIQRRQADSEAQEAINSVAEHLRSNYQADDTRINKFIEVMSDPSSLTVDNLWKLFAMDESTGNVQPQPQTSAPASRDFEQVKRASSIPSPMGVLPSANVDSSPKAEEDRIIDEMVTDYKSSNPFT